VRFDRKAHGHHPLWAFIDGHIDDITPSRARPPPFSSGLTGQLSIVARDRPLLAAGTGRKEKMMNANAFSKSRLDRMHELMTGYVKRGEVPGLVYLLCRHDEVHVDAIGAMSIGGFVDHALQLGGLHKLRTVALTRRP
jgi:hypothetical protein